MALEIYERLDIHQGMCADAVRNQAYRRALEATVTEHSVVLDVGTGTGVLARYAARAGARRVYAIEKSPVAEIARRLAQPFGERLLVQRTDIAEAQIPEPVDLIVSEWMGAFGVDENLLAMVLLARDRWLARGGRLLPEQVSAHMAPLCDANAYSAPLGGDDPMRFTAMRWAAAGVPAECLLASGQTLWNTDMASIPAAQAALPFRGSAQWLARRAGWFEGLVTWFEAGFGADITLSNAPGAPATHWGQFVFALERPLLVRSGSWIEAQLSTIPVAPGYCHHAYSVRVDHGPWQHHDTRGRRRH